MSTNPKENWIRMAVQQVRAHAKDPLGPYEFTAEDFASFYPFLELDRIAAGIDSRRWGEVFQRAQDEGLIQKQRRLGRDVKARVMSRHRMQVWEYA